nr:hypothetical protein [Tanacetum cinerariifolium]
MIPRSPIYKIHHPPSPCTTMASAAANNTAATNFAPLPPPPTTPPRPPLSPVFYPRYSRRHTPAATTVAIAATVTTLTLITATTSTMQRHQQPLPHMNLPPPPAPQRQRQFFQPLPSPWRAVDVRLAATVTVELRKIPISCLFSMHGGYIDCINGIFNLVLIDLICCLIVAVRRQTTIVVAVGRRYSHHSRTLWCRAVMAQPLVKHKGGQLPKTT